MRRFYSLVLAVCAMSFMGHIVCAQEIDSLATNLEIAADSIVVSSDPEWYVAPEIPRSLRAPRRATAAAACVLDSVLTFNIDSVLVESTNYAYDAAGHAINQETWTVNTDGSRVGKEKLEYGYTGSKQTMTAVYEWDTNTNDWKGTERFEYTYSGSRMTSNTSFIWLNNAWVADSKYTWAYDAAGNEIEYYEYNRNTTTNQLEKIYGRLQEWYNKDTKTKEILYTAFVNNQPTEGTWKELHFDANGNKTLDMYYPSIVNGAWVGQNKEEWAYADTVLTMNAKYEWGETDWVGTFKEEWNYTDSVLTMNAKYEWGETDWVGTFKEEWNYTDSVLTMNAKYEWGENDWVGTFKEEWGYTDEVLTMNAKYAWVNSDWTGTLKEVWGYTNDTLTLYENYATYTNGIWVGCREQFTYTNGEKTYYLKQTGSADNWKNSIQETWEYNGPNGDKTYYEKQVWRSNAWGDSIQETWVFGGPDGKETLHEKYSWNTSAEALLKSLEYTDEYDGDGHLIRRERYTFTNGVRKGTTYYTYTYVNGKKTAYTIYAWDETISAWVGDKNERWGYNGPSSKQTLHEKSEWENGDWVLILQDSTEYTGSNITKKENYERIGGVWTGTLKEVYGYNGTKKVEAITYNWVNNAWVEDTKETWNPSSTKPTKHEMFSWNGEWVKTLEENTTYDGSNIISIVNYELLEGVWTGTKGEEYTYTDGQKTRTIIYAWENNNWVESTKEEWGFTSGKETLHKQYIWTGSWTLTLEENTAYDGANKVLVENYALIEGVWTGTKKEAWGYTSGKQTLHEQYVWNGDWQISLQENTVYDGANKVLVENYELIEGVWTGTQKEAWAYTSGRVTQHEQYIWTGNWTKTLQENTVYDGANKVLVENYALIEGVWKGTEREVWNYTGGHLTFHEIDEWYNNNWALTLREISAFDDADNQTLVENYTGENGVETGIQKEEYTFDGSTKTMTIKYMWSNDGWVYFTKSEIGYQDGNTEVSAANYVWNGVDWRGSGDRTFTTRDDQDRVVELLTQNWPTGATDWTNSKITTNTYDEDGEKIAVYNANWNGSDWTMTSRQRLDIIKDDQGRTLLKAQWKCSSNGTWSGVKKDTTAYSPSGKKLYDASITAWKSKKWAYGTGSYEYKYEYDAQDRTILEQHFQWKSNRWQGHYKKEYEYDDEDRELMYTYYDDWDTYYNNWMGNTKRENTYHSSGQYSEQVIYESFDSGKNKWIPTFKYSYSYDEQDREIEKIVQVYVEPNWLYSSRSEKEYLGDKLVKSNTYIRKDGKWVFSTRSEQYYDADAQAKLRREITGAWNNGELASFADNHHSYSCDALTIRFVNYDGTVLETQTLDKGAKPVYTGLTPTKPADVENSYTFAGWTPAITEVTGNATYTATFTAIKNSYTVTWLNADSTLIDQTSVEYGVMPSHDGATKSATAEWTYTFADWSPGLGIVTGDVTYVATFDSTKNSYTITWLNEDETLIDQTTVEYGVMPTHDDVSKAATDEHSYVFAGWTPELVAVTANATYKATFTATKKSYTVTWLNADSTLIDQTTVEYGLMPTHDDATKTNTAEWTYTFAGWTPALTEVIKEATYVATFDSTKNSYTITWLNADSTLIDQTTLEYGVMPEHDDATKTNTAEYTYTFAGWSPAVLSVTGEATYKATFDSTLNAYTVIFRNGDQVLQSTDVEYGASPSYTGATPTKDATVQYSYTFSRWDKELTEVTAEQTYTALFDSTLNSYIVTFKDADGTPLDSKSWEYGATPICTSPTKEPDSQYEYEFAGWTPAVSDVAGDATYTATYSTSTRKYTIIFLNEDGTELQNSRVEAGTTPAYLGETPTKDPTDQYSYTFAGWDKTVSAVTGDATYTATYDSLVRTYTVTFYFGDGVTILEQMELEYGAMPEMAQEPARLADPEFSYEFAGWDPEIAMVTGDAAYTASYTATVNSYTIVFRNDDGTELQREVLEYGYMPIYAGEEPTKQEDERYTYTFAGWKPAVGIAKADAVYTAYYTATKKKQQGLEDIEAGASAAKLYIEGNIYILRAGHAYAPDGTKLY